MKKLNFFVVVIMVFSYNHKEPRPVNITETPKEIKQNVKDVIQMIHEQRVYDSLYNEFIGHLKHFEGYRSNPYYCRAGVKTVGYGHVIKKNDSLSLPLSKKQADSLLRVDFNERINWVKKEFNFNHYKEPYKVLSLAHFVFNVGYQNIIESSFYKTLKNKKKLSETMKKYVYIKTNKGYVKSIHLEYRRNFEFYMFHKKI
jgi:lysozyme